MQTQIWQFVIKSRQNPLFLFCNKSCIPVSEAICPVLLAQPCECDVQRHCADQGIVLDLLARGQCRNLLLLVQVGHREVLAVSLQAANTFVYVCLAIACRQQTHLFMFALHLRANLVDRLSR